MTGKVLWFNVRKGYGFIRSDEKDYFVHYSKIHAPAGEFRLLDEGDIVEFEEFMADRGKESKPQAMNVKVVRGKTDEVQRDNEHHRVRRYVDVAK